MSSETRQSPQRYWCHICNAEVNIYMAPEPTCQQCNEQFIEEVNKEPIGVGTATHSFLL